MLFNSLEFILGFLPITIIGYFALARYGAGLAMGFLALASLVFYGWWDIRFVPLLLASAIVNFWFGKAIGLQRTGNPKRAKQLLIAAISVNLLLLSIFKYLYFLGSNIAMVTGVELAVPKLVLPLGISFFTFTQLAYLVDAHRGEAKEYDFVRYLLFVTYFPHLIAGPILHHKEMMPQFGNAGALRPDGKCISVGLSLFAFGLFKKIVLADSLSESVGAVFESAERGPVRFLEAWFAALAYTLQLYLDFSAYCEMAMGLSLLFGIRLPLNFFSPYKATNIIEFWRRWHMTLSRFLRDYLYIPLGGNKYGTVRRYINLLVTMVLGGLWHGAAWTFVIWGALHGVYLVINHAWQQTAFAVTLRPRRWWRLISQALMLLAVVVGWVVFRSTSMDGAMQMLEAMLFPVLEYPRGLDLKVPMVASALHALGFAPAYGFAPGIDMSAVAMVVILVPVMLTARSIPEVFNVDRVALPTSIAHRGPAATGLHGGWQPNAYWAALCAALLIVAITMIHRQSEFLYYQF